MDWVFWLQSLVILILGTLGALLFQYGVNQVGAINPWDVTSWVRLVFTPGIFFGLFSLMLSRILWSLPLTKMGIGKYSALIIPLNIIAITVSSAIIFKESINIKQVIGILLGFIAVFLISSE